MWIKKSVYEALNEKIYYLEQRQNRQMKYNACENCIGCKNLLTREVENPLTGRNFVLEYYCKLNNECDSYAE